MWRHHEPITRSEGAPPNKTPYAVIIGLTGLEIEAHETIDWPKNFSPPEVERACKYASFELNGFPTWFPKLFEKYSKNVGDFLLREIRYDLSVEKPDNDTNYIISDISWSGQWAWDPLAPRIYELLQTSEPINLTNLDHLLKIIQGSNLPDELIEKLAAQKCRSHMVLNHLARWLAMWASVSPNNAIAYFKTRIRNIADPKAQTSLAMNFATCLVGGRRGNNIANRKAFVTPKHLRSLYLLMHKYIRHDEDINRADTGVYTPELRDDAQDARNNLFELLNQIPGKEAFVAITEIAKSHPDISYRPWITLHAKNKAENDCDIAPWSASQVREFNDKHELAPSNHRELADLAILRLLDLKDDLERADSSIANILRNVKKETDMRKFIGHELREKAFGRYSIPQEEELADAKRPDLRFHGVGFDGPVPVELKLADNWCGAKLFERLENQLCGDYLRDNRSNRGIFLLVFRGDKMSWKVPCSTTCVDFDGLISALKNTWTLISPKFTNVDDITVIGIDLTKRSR